MKVTIDEICKFLNEGWPGDDWYMEDYSEDTHERYLTYEKKTDRAIPKSPGEKVNLADFDCCISWQGQGADPTNREGMSFATVFKRWKKKQTTTFLTFEVDNDQVEAVEAFIKSLKKKTTK